MHLIYLAFLAFAVPIFFALVVWAAVMVGRLCFPDQELPIDSEVFEARWEAADERQLIGVREIQKARKHRERRRQHDAPFHYVVGDPLSRLPEAWIDELWMRRN